MNRNNKGAFSGYQYIFSLCKAMSYVMDETYLRACVRSNEMNPARAGIAMKPEQWPWSSASAHISGYDDTLVKAAPLLEITGDKWKNFYLCGWIWSCNFNYFFTAASLKTQRFFFYLPLRERQIKTIQPCGHQKLLQRSCWAVPLCRSLNGKGEIIFLCALCVFAVNTRFSWSSKTET